MKSILRAAMHQLELALDSGLLISDDYEQAMLLDDLLEVKRDRLNESRLER